MGKRKFHHIEMSSRGDLRRMVRQRTLRPEIVITKGYINHLVKTAMIRMALILSFAELEREDVVAGKKILKDLRKNKEEKYKDRAEEIIKALIDDSPNTQILKTEKNQSRVPMNQRTSAVVNKSNLKNVKKLTKDTFYEEIDENELVIDEFTPQFQDGVREIKEFEEKNFNCSCTGGKCGKDCPCHILDKTLHKSTGLHHTCNVKCQCHAQCSKSLQIPPGTAQKTVHKESAKGVVLEAKVYTPPGKPVMMFNGKIRPDEKVPYENCYAYNLHTNTAENKGFEQVFKNNKELKQLSLPYQKTLKKIIKRSSCLDPLVKGNEGRFVSHSCFPNLETERYLSKGLNPNNTKLVFNTLLHVFPHQEYSVFYSMGYLFSRLKNTCLCGHLCCVKNIDIFPYITKEHLEDFFKKVYGELLKLYKNDMKKMNRRAS